MRGGVGEKGRSYQIAGVLGRYVSAFAGFGDFLQDVSYFMNWCVADPADNLPRPLQNQRSDVEVR
jgi:hypothetical protein